MEVRDYLKGRLPSYAVPTVFIVLNKLLLNSNRKVNKPNLPFFNIAEQIEEALDEDLKRWESLTETERTIATKWADLIRGLNAKTVIGRSHGGQTMGEELLMHAMRDAIR